MQFPVNMEISTQSHVYILNIVEDSVRGGELIRRDTSSEWHQTVPFIMS